MPRYTVALATLLLAACAPATPRPVVVVVDVPAVDGTNTDIDSGDFADADTRRDTGLPPAASEQAPDACSPDVQTYADGDALADLRGLEVTLCRYDSGAVQAWVHAYELDQARAPVCGATSRIDVLGTIFDPGGTDWWSVWTPGASADGCAAGALPAVWVVQGNAYIEGDDARFDRVERTHGDGWTRITAQRVEVVR
jgi:hypothetical protein